MSSCFTCTIERTWPSIDLLRRKLHPPPPPPCAFSALHAQWQDFLRYCPGHMKAPDSFNPFVGSRPLARSVLHCWWPAPPSLGSCFWVVEAILPVHMDSHCDVSKNYPLWWQPTTRDQHMQCRQIPQLSCSSARTILRWNLHYFQHFYVKLNEGSLCSVFPGIFLLGFPHFSFPLLQALKCFLNTTSYYIASAQILPSGSASRENFLRQLWTF